jgi:hypothetical protein
MGEQVQTSKVGATSFRFVSKDDAQELQKHLYDEAHID